VRQKDQRPIALQSMDSGRLLLVGSVAVLVIACLVHTLAQGFRHADIPIVFGLYIAFGELLRLSLPGLRQAAPVAMSAALAYAMTQYIAKASHGVPGRMHIVPAASPVMEIITVTAIGMAIGALPHIAADRPADITGMAARLLAVASVAAIFHAVFMPLLSYPNGWHARWFWVADLAVMAALATFGWLVETVIMAIIRADDLRARYMVTLADELAVQWRLGMAAAVSAIITVFGAMVMGLVEIAVFAGPLLVIWLAFRRYAGIRATHLQTVRALAQATEVGGYVENGHSRRVTVFALAIGRQLGMPETELIDLEYAALMHDIGQLALVEPTPGGATVQLPPAAARRIAELGAAVIKKTGVMETVADLVRLQWLPFRGGPGEPPLGSRIVRAANAYDDMVAGSSDRDRTTAALARLRADAATEYDPVVVEALATVAQRIPAWRLQ
jgi:HD domain